MSCPGVRQVASRAALAEGRRAEEGCAIRWRGEAPQPRLECDEPADMCIAASMLEDDLGLPEDVHGRPDDLGLAKGGRRVSPAESYRLGQWSRQGAGETGEEEIEGQGRADRTAGASRELCGVRKTGRRRAGARARGGCRPVPAAPQPQHGPGGGRRRRRRCPPPPHGARSRAAGLPPPQ